eukprot:CAMPEP_0198572508 /NCGR_PEP_ID=MMETSP1462-20131121/111914_1 /TAXON_ID=1333877 /ORGANISM="Brandtodinium nutriculum, Strain RCC3387" /LENGTH=145 /DNA_ID=CAMNT_0044303667 /DNA_START=298 /DNA_END=732 /DNA_ORIENTATION=+
MTDPTAGFWMLQNTSKLQGANVMARCSKVNNNCKQPVAQPIVVSEASSHPATTCDTHRSWSSGAGTSTSTSPGQHSQELSGPRTATEASSQAMVCIRKSCLIHFAQEANRPTLSSTSQSSMAFCQASFSAMSVVASRPLRNSARG